MTITTEARHATIDQVRDILQAQHDAQLDVVAPAAALRYEGGRLILAGQGPERLIGDTIDDMTLAPSDLALDVSDNAERQLLGADRLAIHASYARRMRDGDHLDLLDTNVNYWLQRDARSFLVRAFTDGEGGGLARAVLSDSYGMFDHVDFLTGVLTALGDSGAEFRFRAVNLTERNLRLDILFPNVTVEARELTRGYVSPFNGMSGEDLPIITSGVRFQNSETGHGKWSFEPFAEMLVCTNGMTLTKYAPDFSIKHIHRGRRLEAGAVAWSLMTRRRQAEALVAEAHDVIRHFSGGATFAETIAKVEQAAGQPVAATEAADTITRVSKGLAFTEAERDEVFRAFNEGGQLTAGGVVNAITAAAQRVANPDRATDMEAKALEALSLV